ncbi:lysoplasmalogenase family protein [Candidatus Enterovibrio altilux]|uniref:Uncharacterized protein n=2 Tax=Candidatus Enterovibrio altilux TaxID=1927128 RepID=A0A291B9L7_9GAMM|nr:lysoplasmalogenase family protein [Candidatus Enterovibrio luxaltus]ATF09709.1 hypothetical protein BTN50_1220 [Candidatus Enterovibrio luxaltus]
MIPVALYIAIIEQMARGAGEFWMSSGSQTVTYVSVDVSLLMILNTVLAFERSRGPSKALALLIMTTYFCA